jgi:hypothetical protein
LDLGTRRPQITRRPRRRVGLRGIDAAGEQSLETLIDARPPQCPLDQRVEAERRQMAFVEDDRVAERDRL